MRTNPKDLTGKIFGKLTVLGVYGKLKGKTAMLCVYTCGSETTATVGHLVGGRRSSCGCSKTEGWKRHGRRYSPEYGTWLDMVKRCSNPKHPSYRYYGASGVQVCDRWKKFDNFFADMGERPPGMTIDRIDNDKGYEPGNCRWATPQTQTENRRCQKFVELDGKAYTLPKFGEAVGLSDKTIRSRMRRGGMTLLQAVNHPFRSPIQRNQWSKE